MNCSGSKTFSDDVSCGQHQSSTGHKGMARVNDEKPPVWMCAQCQKMFPNMNALQQHQDDTGHGDVPVCMSCRKKFPNEPALLQHQMAKNHCGIFWERDGDDDDASSSDDEAYGGQKI